MTQCPGSHIRLNPLMVIPREQCWFKQELQFKCDKCCNTSQVAILQFLQTGWMAFAA